ncbi:hypothetical protein [Neisseria sp. Marseille-Q2251]|uniref:hypothetical protein n=1 Tax=Neisseria sp. Marseille-Q2251 TaxID=2866585 RepID=UPI0031389D62
MGKFHTPLGNLTLITEETTNISFLQGKFDEISFSIQVSQPFNLGEIDFNFIQNKMNNFSQIKVKTELFLRNILYTQPKQLGFNHYKDKLDETKELISFPEFMFYEKTKDWDIIFRESQLPIAEPYGILINYHDNDVVGFEDLSDSEEL